MNRKVLRRVWYAASALFVLAGVAAWAVMASRSTEGTSPSVDVPQTAEATAGGYAISVQSAAFSATGTYLLLLVVPVTGLSTTHVELVPEASQQGSLRLVTIARLRLGEPSVVRFEPLQRFDVARVQLSAIWATGPDGERTIVAGPWDLPLELPSDLGLRLASESLNGATVSDAGIEVAVEGAARSASETLVTVRVRSAVPVTHLGGPTANIGGKRHEGVLVAEDEGGTLLTFAFPSGRFGQPLQLNFGPWLQLGTGRSGTIDLRLAGILARHGSAALTGVEMPVTPADVADARGAAPVVLGVHIPACTSTEHPGGLTCVQITLQGARELRADAVTVVAAGRTLDAFLSEIRFSTSPTGVISGGTSGVVIRLRDLADVPKVVTIVDAAAPQEIVRGDWAIELRP